MEIERRIVSPEIRFSNYLSMDLPVAKYSPPLPSPSSPEENRIAKKSIKHGLLVFGMIAFGCVCWYLKVRSDKKKRRELEETFNKEIFQLQKGV